MLSGRPGNPILSEREIKEVLPPVGAIKENISGTHIWGYDINKQWGAHKADLNIYFNNDQKLKGCFLQEICKLFDDGIARYFVPEVNKTIQVHSIVSDLRNAGIQFVEP